VTVEICKWSKVARVLRMVEGCRRKVLMNGIFHLEFLSVEMISDQSDTFCCECFGSHQSPVLHLCQHHTSVVLNAANHSCVWDVTHSPHVRSSKSMASTGQDPTHRPQPLQAAVSMEKVSLPVDVLMTLIASKRQ
jgi:hypothetical protein